MHKSKLIGAAIGGAISAAALLGTVTVNAMDLPPEKCYGIAKKGKNDCQTSTSACAGTSTKDRQGDAWIYVPGGTCSKIAGGTLEPKKG